MESTKPDVKPTTIDPNVLDHIIKFASSSIIGVTDQEVADSIPNVSNEERLQYYNFLLKKGRLSLRVKKDGTILYQAVNVEEASKLKGLTVEDRTILSFIEKSGNMGIWSRDLRFKSGFQQNQLAKNLKTLESRKLIKSVKSIQSKNKKVYMLFDTVPSKQITGGPWYNDEQELDVEFINVLSSQIIRYMNGKSQVSLSEIVTFIGQSGISQIELEQEHLDPLMDMLAYDDMVKRVTVMETGEKFDLKEKYFKIARPGLGVNNLTTTPCGVCPVRKECTHDGVISPYNCTYLNPWLDSLDF